MIPVRLSTLGSLKGLLKRMLFHLHKALLRAGLAVVPVHYYSSVPNLVELENRKDVWAKKSKMPGIDVDLDGQIQSLMRICNPYRHEFEGNRSYREAVSRALGPGFGYVEAQALHAVIRYFKPRTIVEVGSGVSTHCSREAVKINDGETGMGSRIVCIEPYPSKVLESMKEITLHRAPVQEVDVSLFDILEANDLLFIDSSHTVKTGSDVNFLILEILPRLKPGVIVHFHDINFPYDYMRTTLKTFFDWSEGSLLQAFLIHNDKMKILFCLSHLHYERTEALKIVFPEYIPQEGENGLMSKRCKPFERPREHFPSSIYLQVQ